MAARCASPCSRPRRSCSASRCSSRCRCARSRRTLLTYFAHTIYSGDHEHLVCAGPRRAVPREQPVLQRGGAEAEPGGRQPPPAHHDPDAGVQGESEGDDVRVLSPFFPGVILAISMGLGAQLRLQWIRRPGFHVDDRWDPRARRDLRGIAVSPLGLGWACWAARSRLRRYSGPGTRLGLIETSCFDADLSLS